MPKTPEGGGSPQTHTPPEAEQTRGLSRFESLYIDPQSGRPLPEKMKVHLVEFAKRMSSAGLDAKAIEQEIPFQRSIILDSYRDQRFHMPNGEYFRLELDRLILQYQEQGSEKVALLTFDLNGLKAVNDTAGHAAGDAFLKRIAHEFEYGEMTAELRRRGFNIFASVVGGDEFTLIVSGDRPIALDDFNEKIVPAFQMAIQGIDCSDLLTKEILEGEFGKEVPDGFKFHPTIAGGCATLAQANERLRGKKNNVRGGVMGVLMSLSDQSAITNKMRFKEKLQHSKDPGEHFMGILLARNPETREALAMVERLEQENVKLAEELWRRARDVEDWD